MEFNKRKSVSDDLKKYDVFAKDNDFIEVTEWSNGEGIDVNINDTIMSFSYDTLDAINYLAKSLNYDKEN